VTTNLRADLRGGIQSSGRRHEPGLVRRKVPQEKSDFDEDLLTVEGIDNQPADENESQRVEQGREGRVRNYAVDGAVEGLLQVDTRASVDVVDPRGQQLGEDVGCDRVGAENEQRREDA
jgi:hypothetical protein